MEMLGFALIAAEFVAVAGLTLDFGFRNMRTNTIAFDLGRDSRCFAVGNSTPFENIPFDVAYLLKRERVLSGRVAALEARLDMARSFSLPHSGR